MRKIKLILIIFFMVNLFNFTIVLADTPVINYEGELNYPPFNYIENDYQSGFDVDLTNLIFRQKDYHVNYSMGNWDEVYNNIKTGKIDTCGLMAVNDSRKKDVLFSDIVMQFNAAIYTRKSFNKYVNVNNLKKYKIGLGKNQYTESILKNKIGINQYTTYLNIQDAIDALYKGEIDVVFENQEVVSYLLIQKNLKNYIVPKQTNLYPSEVAFAVKKGKPELVSYINRRLSELEKSGAYEELYQKYFFSHSKYYSKIHNMYFIEIIVSILCALTIIGILLNIYIKYLRKKILKVNEELYKNKEWLRITLSSICDAVIATDKNGIITFFNSTAVGMTGINEEHALGKNVDKILNLYKQDGEVITEIPIYKVIREDKYFKLDEKIVLLSNDGIEYNIYNSAAPIKNDSGQVVGAVMVLKDITEKEHSEKIIYNMAYFDALTGLPNRSQLENRLANSLNEAKNLNKKLAVMFLDLDNFKSFNDTFGHIFGDHILQVVSKLLINCCDSRSTVARMGGDEFIFLINDVNSREEIINMAEGILNIFGSPIIVEGRYIYITASIGVAVYPNDGEGIQAILSNADAAMYYAKENGKNAFRFHNKEMNIKLSRRLDIEQNLRSALKNDEFIVFYQPKLNVLTGKVESMEALVRWQKCNQIISPGEFIPIAEESELIIPIGREVLRKACIQNKEWQDKGYEGVRVAVNLSTCQFHQKNFLDKVKSILDESGLDPNFLEFEITESVAMKDLDLTIKVLNELRSMGIHISLDDFGTGYSSLNYLKRLPINTLKIDKTFVDDLAESATTRNILRAIVIMAHNFNLSVVAEGVETKEQLEILKVEGCDLVQGYLFSKPVINKEFENILKNPVLMYE